jgi:hypothetical protein
LPQLLQQGFDLERSEKKVHVVLINDAYLVFLSIDPSDSLLPVWASPPWRPLHVLFFFGFGGIA